MMRPVSVWAIAGVLLLSIQSSPSAEVSDDLAARAGSVITAHCIKCHGPETQKSGLRLDSLAHMLLGGNGGAVVRIEAPEESTLLRAIRYQDEMLRMPPDAPLPEDARATLEAWARAGMPWPETTPEEAATDAAQLLDLRVAADEKLWAFRAVQRTNPPDTMVAPIDAFVQAALQTLGLAPSPPADRRTLIRRVYLDVLGLPPAPEEIEAFVQDPDPAAYEKLVDRVLGSPAYGERWARHWLDVVRFAETNGFETNTPRKNAWQYRDYVINAFNDDKPYPQFVREQIAGDALGVDAATGFLVGGPWDEVKSPDVVLTKNQRDAELHDMAATVGGAFLGLTVGCAKCHEHKFDPISQQDYYALRAVFQGVQHGEREVRPPDADQRMQQAGALREDLAALEGRLAQYIPVAAVSGLSVAAVAQGSGGVAATAPLRPAVQSKRNVERFAPVLARYIRFTIFETTDAEPCLDELEIWSAEETPRNVALAQNGARATASSEYSGSEKHRIAHLNDGEYGNDHSWIPAAGKPSWAQIELSEPLRVDRVVWGRDLGGAFKDRLPTRYAIEVAAEPEHWQLVATSLDRAPRDSQEKVKPVAEFVAEDPASQASLDTLLGERKNLQSRIADLLNFPKVYGGKFEEPTITHLLYRGDPMQERQEIAPAALRFVRPALHLQSTTPEQQRRLQLADWIASAGNPLTARVLVNRIWQHHFGRGIVATPSDFGAMGARPTHPELLDWLVAELVAHGWRMKPIHRMILLSSTYRQSSAPRNDALAVDADAHFLWRFPPRRLEAEPIRDSILSVSGVLEGRMGGPGYQVFEQNENYVRVYNPKTEFGPEEWRRMIYQTKPRSQQDATFGIFDCPDGGQMAPRRNTSTTPLQALNLLNSPFLVQQGQLFAERLTREEGNDLGKKITRAFELAFGRPPEAAELDESSRLVQEHGLPVLCRALYNASEFLYLE